METVRSLGKHSLSTGGKQGSDQGLSAYHLRDRCAEMD